VWIAARKCNDVLLVWNLLQYTYGMKEEEMKLEVKRVMEMKNKKRGKKRKQ
jgi:hypothetical protein